MDLATGRFGEIFYPKDPFRHEVVAELFPHPAAYLVGGDIRLLRRLRFSSHHKCSDDFTVLFIRETDDTDFDGPGVVASSNLDGDGQGGGLSHVIPIDADLQIEDRLDIVELDGDVATIYFKGKGAKKLNISFAPLEKL